MAVCPYYNIELYDVPIQRRDSLDSAVVLLITRDSLDSLEVIYPKPAGTCAATEYKGS